MACPMQIGSRWRNKPNERPVVLVPGGQNKPNEHSYRTRWPVDQMTHCGHHKPNEQPLCQTTRGHIKPNRTK